LSNLIPGRSLGSAARIRWSISRAKFSFKIKHVFVTRNTKNICKFIVEKIKQQKREEEI